MATAAGSRSGGDRPPASSPLHSPSLSTWSHPGQAQRRRMAVRRALWRSTACGPRRWPSPGMEGCDPAPPVPANAASPGDETLAASLAVSKLAGHRAWATAVDVAGHGGARPCPTGGRERVFPPRRSPSCLFGTSKARRLHLPVFHSLLLLLRLMQRHQADSTSHAPSFGPYFLRSAGRLACPCCGDFFWIFYFWVNCTDSSISRPGTFAGDISKEADVESMIKQ
jgi:hypothetical protein